MHINGVSLYDYGKHVLVCFLEKHMRWYVSDSDVEGTSDDDEYGDFREGSTIGVAEAAGAAANTPTDSSSADVGVGHEHLLRRLFVANSDDTEVMAAIQALRILEIAFALAAGQLPSLTGF